MSGLELANTVPNDVDLHNMVAYLVVENTKLIKEYEKYKSIIKEVKEYVRSNEWAKDYEISSCRTHLLEILDKENKDEK